MKITADLFQSITLSFLSTLDRFPTFQEPIIFHSFQISLNFNEHTTKDRLSKWAFIITLSCNVMIRYEK